MAKIEKILMIFSLDLTKSHQILRDLAKSSEDFMDLVEILLDLENLVGKCYVSWSGLVSLGFGENI